MPQSAKVHEPVQSLLWDELFGKPVAVEFSAERLTDNAGLLLPAAVDRRWGLTELIAAGVAGQARSRVDRAYDAGFAAAASVWPAGRFRGCQRCGAA